MMPSGRTSSAIERGTAARVRFPTSFRMVGFGRMLQHHDASKPVRDEPAQRTNQTSEQAAQRRHRAGFDHIKPILIV